MAIPNTVRQESKRVSEYVPIGAIKFSASGAPEAAGAETAEPTGTVSVGSLNTITGVSAFTNIVVGSAVSDEGQKKFFPTASEVYVTAINETAKTITVSVEAVRKLVVEAEATKANEGQKFLFTNVLKFAGAETKTIPLTSAGYQFSDYTGVELNLSEGTAAKKLTAFLESSYDGGKTWKTHEALGKAEVTATGSNFGEVVAKEKVLGTKFRVALKSEGASAYAGFVQLVTDPTGINRVR